MLKCEINKNIASQRVEIYLFDANNYYIYTEEGIESHPKEYTYSVNKPYLTIPYDIWDSFKEAFKIINDLNKVLNHFMAKDKK